MSLLPTDVSPTSDHVGGPVHSWTKYLTRNQQGWSDDDYMRFYMGTIWIS